MAIAIDPICKMEVDTGSPPGGQSEYQGTSYYSARRVARWHSTRNRRSTSPARPLSLPSPNPLSSPAYSAGAPPEEPLS